MTPALLAGKIAFPGQFSGFWDRPEAYSGGDHPERGVTGKNK
jgi:hypothetical protein